MFHTHFAYAEVSLLPVMLSHVHDCQGPDSAVTLSPPVPTPWSANVILKLNIQMHSASAPAIMQAQHHA